MSVNEQALMRMHIAEFCERRGIALDERVGFHGLARLEDRTIVTPPITGTTAYLIALHELGHLMADEGMAADRLLAEVAAWEWALEQAVVDPTADAAAAMARCLETYQGASWDRAVRERAAALTHRFARLGELARVGGRRFDSGALDVHGLVTGRVEKGRQVPAARWY